MTVPQLKDICDARGIKRIAMVDDVFDSPSIDGLDLDRYKSFHKFFTQDQTLQSTVARVTGRSIETLPQQPDDLEEKDINALWQSTWRPYVGGKSAKQSHRTALRALFREHDDNLLAMLDEIAVLFQLFANELSRSVDVYGTDFDPEELAKADIIVLDFFLGPSLTDEEAFKKASQVVKDTISEVKRPRAAPSFLLVTNRPDNIDVKRFRRCTELMKSRFRFFSKDKLKTTSTENMANLYDVVAASDHTARVEELLDDWCRGAGCAIQHVRETFLSLDVSDLTYLDCFRLAHEGVSVPSYLKWFLTSLLSANVASELTKKTWSRLDEMRFADVFDSGGNLDSKSLMATFDGPTDEIAHAYGDIIFDTDRPALAKTSASRAHPWRDLMEGDLFVRPKGRDRKRLEGVDVRLVLTPGCDLRIRGDQQSPSAPAVVLLPGVLSRVLTEDKNRNFAEGCFIRAQDQGASRLLHIAWDYHRPMSLEWQQVATSGPGKGFKRLGRIRDLYFHKVKETFLTKLTRIGTEVAPVYPHALSGKVYILVGQNRQEHVMSFCREDGYVWEIGPVKDSLKKNSKTRYLYQVSRSFLQSLNSELSGRQDDDSQVAGAVLRATKLLDDLGTFVALVRPGRSGRRPGVAGPVEIKQSAPRAGAKSDSQAPILIVPFSD